jgi:hypothetical protein
MTRIITNRNIDVHLFLFLFLLLEIYFVVERLEE